MRTSILFIAILIGSVTYGQELISSSGSTVGNSNVQLSFSLGELNIATNSNSGMSLTQGFHQSKLSLIPLATVEEWGTEIFPNPARNNIQIRLNDPTGLLLSIHDLNGRIVRRAELKEKTTSINLMGLGDGAYQILITDPKNQKSENYLIVKRK